MYWWPIFIAIMIGLFLMLLERIIPGRKLRRVETWWLRVIAVNIIQFGILVIGGLTWEKWIIQHKLFDLSFGNPLAESMLAYFISTFVFYWWHRWRHDINFLWLYFHQVHHSPSRIETITSFYKHPLEIFINSIILSLIVYIVLGFSPLVLSLLALLSSIGEFLYHMNIRTPYWWGHIFQRPENHRIHHEQGKHYNNFSDLPFWDILFGTFENSRREVLCGFKENREQKISKMLIFKNVNNPFPKQKKSPL